MTGEPRMTTFLLIASFPESILTFRGPLIDALLAQGLTVHVAAPDVPATSALRGPLESRGVQVHEIPLRRAGTNPLADLALLRHLWRLMRRIKPTMVLGYTIKPVIYGSLAAWLARVPQRYALITGLGYTFQDAAGRGVLRRLARRLYALALRRVHKVFFQNPDDQALFRERGILGAGTPSVVVNGSGVDVARYTVAPLPSGPPGFLLIARLLDAKGVRIYAQAAEQVRARCPQARFRLVGWLDDNPDTITPTELERWTSAGTVEFLGRLEDVRPAITDCQVYVLPSYYPEGTPRTVLEAMAMGRAIITTDAPGCRETVVDGDNGFLIPVKSVSALVEAMERLIADPTLVERMGRRSRQIAEEKYDVHKVNAVMLREMGIEALRKQRRKAKETTQGSTNETDL